MGYNYERIPKKNFDKLTFDNIKEVAMKDEICVKCNGPASCSQCKPGYFMATNNLRETFDKNISRNPSLCRKCNVNDDIYEASPSDKRCVCTCASAEDNCSCASELTRSSSQCWKNPEKNHGCRACSEIRFNYKINKEDATNK